MSRADTAAVLFETVHLRKDGSEFPVEVSSLGADVGGDRLLISVVRDITERKLLLSRARARAGTSDRRGGAPAGQRRSAEPGGRTARKVMETLNCQAFFNFVADERRGCLHLNACAGIPLDTAREIEWLEYGTAVCGCVARDGCRIVAEDIQKRPDARTALVKSLGIQAYACHPLLAGGKVIGTLSFGATNRPAFSEDDLSLMQAVAHHIAVAMERVEAQKRLRESEERYRAIARSIPDGGVLVVDDQMFCLVMDGELAGRLGMSRETVEGRHSVKSWTKAYAISWRSTSAPRSRASPGVTKPGIGAANSGRNTCPCAAMAAASRPLWRWFWTSPSGSASRTGW